MNFALMILAQAEPAGPPAPPQGAPSAMPSLFLAVMFAMLVFMMLSARSQKKREQRDRDHMFTNLQKNDRVQTVGGVLGTILSIKDNEVVLKVDESTNTKMTFIKSAIQRVLKDEPVGKST
jgi:preprotein translocase subunit YajC